MSSPPANPPSAYIAEQDGPRTPRPAANSSDNWNMPAYAMRHSSEEEFPRRHQEATATTDEDDNTPKLTNPFAHDIAQPEQSFTRNERRRSSARRPSVSFLETPSIHEIPATSVDDAGEEQTRAANRRSALSHMMDLGAFGDHATSHAIEIDPSIDSSRVVHRRPNAHRMDSYDSNDSEVDDEEFYDNETRSRYVEDTEDIERNTLREMDYKARRKHLTKASIKFNVTSMLNRQEFLLMLAKALMTFGAPSHRIESQLISAARILEVEAEFIHLPGVIISSFGDQELGCSETQFINRGPRRDQPKQATEQLKTLISEPPAVPKFVRYCLAYALSALICPLAFGGSFIDMWIAGAGAFSLAFFQMQVASKSALYANVFEITVSILVSFVARGLSSIRDGELFCYAAISSAGIIGILPGYLILSSSLELASKNIVCGSVKMVYALIYTLFLGFGLQIGSDLYLLFDPHERHNLKSIASQMASGVILTGQWTADNATGNSIMNNTVPLIGTWTFSHHVQLKDLYISNEGCLRKPDAVWYLMPFPTWSAVIIVPSFSLLSSLANLQPFKSKQLPVMVAISCIAWSVNKLANHFIFNRSDVVSAIGAFTVGVLGNIYSRKMGGTAFTSMVTGVLFLVPSGLSQAGGIAGNGSGIDVGGAMIAVTIGITVGLFMSQALVYMFGSRKGGASFSF